MQNSTKRVDNYQHHLYCPFSIKGCISIKSKQNCRCQYFIVHTWGNYITDTENWLRYSRNVRFRVIILKCKYSTSFYNFRYTKTILSNLNNVCVTNTLLPPPPPKKRTPWIDTFAYNKIKFKVLKMKHVNYQMQLIFTTTKNNKFLMKKIYCIRSTIK